MSNRKDVTSLDEDLASSRKVKYDNLQQQCKDWISARVSIDGKADLMDILHDGTVLCELCNTIDPSANLKYKTKKLPFMQVCEKTHQSNFRWKISNFSLDMQSISVFQKVNYFKR